MTAENRKEQLPYEYYLEKAKTMELTEAMGRLGSCFRDGAFHVPLLGRTFSVSCPGGEISAVDGGTLPPVTARTFLLRWLLHGSDAPHSGRWLTFREAPWGNVYLPAFAGRVLRRAAFTFGTRPEAFRAAAVQIGGRPLEQADVGFEFDFLGSYAMRLLIWAGDEDFPPTAQVLYSDNFAADFTAEDRAVAGDLLIARLKENL